MDQHRKSEHDPWVPADGLKLCKAAPVHDRLAARLCRCPQLSWGLPLVALVFYVICRTFFDEITQLGWGMRQRPLPNYESFMAVVTTISGIFWTLGAGMQILLIARRRTLPGVYRHLLPALAISACRAIGFLSLYERTSTVIDTYSNGDDSPRRGPPPNRVPWVLPAP
jgi:hypothetical protein